MHLKILPERNFFELSWKCAKELVRFKAMLCHFNFWREKNVNFLFFYGFVLFLFCALNCVFTLRVVAPFISGELVCSLLQYFLRWYWKFLEISANEYFLGRYWKFLEISANEFVRSFYLRWAVNWVCHRSLARRKKIAPMLKTQMPGIPILDQTSQGEWQQNVQHSQLASLLGVIMQRR